MKAGKIALLVIIIDIVAVLFMGAGSLPILLLSFFILFFAVPIAIVNTLNSRKLERDFGIQGADKVVEGIARTVSERSEPYGMTSQSILNLRIEQIDKEGNITGFMAVEMRGLQIIGNIAEGDRVWVKGKVTDGLMRTKEITNMTTNSVVRIKIQ